MRRASFFLALLLMPMVALFSETLISSPKLGEVKAFKVEYDGNTIFLSKDVCITHDFGALYCDEAEILLQVGADLAKNHNAATAAEKIFLHGNVRINTKDGSSIVADNAEIDCMALQAYFTSIDPNHVISHAKMGDADEPVKTLARAMRITMKKEQDHYVLSDVKAEGSVQMEYQIDKIEG